VDSGEKSMRFSAYFRTFILGCFLLGSASARSEEKKKQAWPASPAVREMLNHLSASLDTTFSPPRLFPEPAYTLGRRNTLYWSTSETRTILEQDTVGLSVLFFEIQAFSDSTGLLWGFVDAGVDSAAFANLPSGISISYQLRYYVGDGNGNYGMSRWSVPEKSIQDVHPPVLEQFVIQDLRSSGGKNWVTQKTITVHVVASDPDSGQVAQVAFREKNLLEDDTLYYDIEPPQAHVDTLIPHTLSVAENELDTLFVWIIDVAGQISQIHPQVFFWWETEDVVCFPNPFNPQLGQISTIQVNLPDVDEARIFDPLGNHVRTLHKHSSEGFFEWDGRNERGNLVANGGYMCVVLGKEYHYCKIAVLR
jgi:hypothetical protein